VKIRFAITLLSVIFVSSFILCGNSNAAPSTDYGKIELLRDRWGIPNIFSDTDEGAFYGLGYAQAEDRAFQMYYTLRIIQGRTAELFGDMPKKKRNTSSITHDKKMRILGFYRYAKRLVPNLDRETVALLQAYSDGVNDYIQEHPDQLIDLFGKYDLEPEAWTPADCIASWWHLGKFFSSEGLHDTMVYHRMKDGDGSGNGAGRNQRQRPQLSKRMEELRQRARNFKPPVDDSAAVVQHEDVSEAWIKKVKDFVEKKRLAVSEKDPDAPMTPKFSHAWVVGGDKTTTGSTVLVSDPQTPVRNPSLFYEYHFCGKTFNARGIGVPGSPAILIGWTEHVAWGLTALGADQADQFMLKTDPAHPNQYFFDGEWRDMTVVTETINVKDGDPITLKLKETHFGPVVSSIAHAVRRGEEVALKRIPQCETDRETIQGVLAMIRAKNIEAFSNALEGWRFPTANIVFGDSNGHIGYWTLSAIPMRSPLSLDGGKATHDGSDSKYDWMGIMPYELLPHVIDPKRGYLLSANHRPIASFYPSTLGISTGSDGDTLRSWRLRERLQNKDKFTPEDVFDIHYDTVNAAKREFFRLGYHLRDRQKTELAPQTLRALKHTEKWYRQGAKSDMAIPGTELANEISTMFRLVNSELAFTHGGGLSGLSRFLKSVKSRLENDPEAELDELEIEYIDSTLSNAWQSANAKYGRDPQQWYQAALKQIRQRTLGYFETLDGFHALGPERGVKFPALSCVDGGTILSQAAQSYTQWVTMHDVDSSQSLLPIGESEHPDSPYRLNTHELWGKGELHPAPVTRKAVEKFTVSRTMLSQ